MKRLRATFLLLVTAMAGIAGHASGEEAIWTDRPVRINRETQTFERLPDRQVSSAAVEAEKKLHFTPDMRVADSANFANGGRSYRLEGITGLPPNTICRRPDGRRWACGVRGRATLRAMILRRTTRCSEVDADADPVRIRCSMAGKDLSAYLILQRLAEAAPPGN